MPTRIPASPREYFERLRAAILARPEILEEGFRVLDADLQAGEAGTIDILGVDRSGSLTLVVFSTSDSDGTLLRLLDLYAWASAESALLARAYGLSRPLTSPATTPLGPIRCILLASAYTHRAVGRLGRLAVDVTPFLARPLGAGREAEFFIEPAAPILGLDQPAAPRAPSSAGPEDRFADGDLMQSLLGGDRAAETGEDAGPEASPPGYAALEETSLPDLHDFPAGIEADRGPYPEPLTTEELEEFERFERQRRGGGRGST